MNTKELWENLSPKAKRYTVVAGSILLFAAVTLAVMPAKKNKDVSSKDANVIRNIITDTDTRKVGIDSLNAIMHINQKETENNKLKISQLENQLAENLKTVERNNQAEIKRLREELEATRAAAASRIGAPPQSQSGAMSSDGRPRPAQDSTVTMRVLSQEISGDPAVLRYQEKSGENQADQKDPREYKTTMPPGSILTGIIITGVDASTGQAANREPFPVMVRINKEAVLPNDNTADVRECFVLLGVYGDLASERIYGRGESLSCIRNDGKVIESKLDGYFSGEDGKNGVRGRLITRDGPLLMRAALAGFLQAWSGAMGSNPVPVVSTTATNAVQYQSAFSNDALHNAAAQGAGKAFEKLGDYYLKLADSMHPLVEIDAGREVNIILTGSINLRLRD
jgi:conjugal transfer pilus assembly protein TraB